MKKSIIGLIASSLLVFPMASHAQVQKQLLLIGEEGTSKFYIDPSTIRKQPPLVWLWSYVTTESKFSDASAFDNFMSVDCGAELIRIYEVISYDRNGDVISTRSFKARDRAVPAREFGAKGTALINSVCQPKR